ncbi:MAG: adenylate/guanylate cyclase domain-containing protein, partial [Phycisphaerae bacterium]|nr:adenylate/guanylate cyclase domain-containing protein [Phycisphaerae bacterium]
KNEPMPIFELMGHAELRDTETGWLATRFEEAFRLYRLQRWQQAEAILLELLARFPEDGPCKAYLERIGQYRINPPPVDWDGVYVAQSK